jgi:hypothetical protein
MRRANTTSESAVVNNGKIAALSWELYGGFSVVLIQSFKVICNDKESSLSPVNRCHSGGC